MRVAKVSDILFHIQLFGDSKSIKPNHNYKVRAYLSSNNTFVVILYITKTGLYTLLSIKPLNLFFNIDKNLRIMNPSIPSSWPSNDLQRTTKFIKTETILEVPKHYLFSIAASCHNMTA